MPRNADPSHLVNPTPGKCRTCGKDVRHPRQYCDEHRPATPQRTPRQAATAKRQRDVAKEGPREVLRDVTHQNAPTPKRPTADATAKLLGRLLVYVTIFIAMALVKGDPDLMTEEQQEAQVNELQLHEEDARAIAHPLARLLHPTAVWQKYGSKVIEHSDVLDALAAAYDYGSSLVRYQRRRAHAEAARDNAPTNGHVPSRVSGPPLVPVNEAAPDRVPDTWGQQVGPTPDQIEEIRRRRASEGI